MFKRLRERIAEEATKFPVGQLNNNSGKQLSDSESKTTGENLTEDLITLSDSSAVVVPHTSPRQFSIGDEDGSTSEQNTPQKQQNEAANIATSEQPPYNSAQRNQPQGTGSDMGYVQEYRPSRSSYVPQSDIESEREDPPTLNLESISKDQLLTIIDLLKARVYKYKNKYSEVVKNYKELRDEKLKIENTLIEHQDKGLRRMAELREQCQLEQKAKAHLEANLRIIMEEKDSRISVLETQINLLKEGAKTFQDGDVLNSDGSNGDLPSDNSSSIEDHSNLKQKIERLEHQSSQAKKTITSQTEQITLLKKQNESLSQELEEKVKNLYEAQDELVKLKADHEIILKNMKIRLEELEKKEEESVMSMAETKRNMHIELELKEKQLKKVEGEAKEYQNNYEAEKQKVLELQKKEDEKINELQHQLESTEKMLEEEKQNLIQEFARGKTAAISLMQQECDKKLLRIEEEWKVKLQNVQAELEKNMHSQNETDENKIAALEEKLKLSEKDVAEMESVKLQLEKENTNLKSSLKKLESDFAITSAKLETLQAEYADFKELNEKETLRYKQQSSIEYSEVVQFYENLEGEHHRREELLKEQLNERQNVIDNISQNKNVQFEQIKALRKSEIELKNNSKALEKELKKINSELHDFKTRFRAVYESDLSKSRELKRLQEQLDQAQSTNTSLVKSLDELKSINENLKSENHRIELNMNLLNEESEKIKEELLNVKEENSFLNDSLHDAMIEFNALTKVLDQKMESFSKLVAQYPEIEHSLTSSENGDKSTASIILKHESVCNELCEKVKILCESFESTQKCKLSVDKTMLKDETANKEPSASNQDKSLVLPGILEYAENKISASEKATSVSDLPSFENKHSECADVKELQNTINSLVIENQKLKQELSELKEFSEIQNIEFAKNITQLHESLNELQDERNNLSLVLQSIESHGKEMNPDLAKCVNGSVSKELSGNVFDGIESEMCIVKLNNKVKSEILALSSQTELINQELKKLREQFNFSQLTSSEKIAQLNSKLLVRTEQLISVKSDLDVSVENCNKLQCLLDSMKDQLNEKDELIKFSEKQKQDLENKCKALNEKFIKQEVSLKELHFTQLSALKEQTKATIDKLNKEIQKANAALKESEVDFQKKISNTKEEYDKKLSGQTIDFEHILECQNIASQISEAQIIFDKNFTSSLDNLSIYNSKINDLNCRLNHIMLKLKEKNTIIDTQQIQIKDLDGQIKSLMKENKDLEGLKDKLKEVSDLFEKSKSDLELETSERKTFEEKFLNLKEAYTASNKEVENINTSAKVEIDNLKSSLGESVSQLEALKVTHTEVCSNLHKANVELEDLMLQSVHFKDIRLKYDSVVKELESVKECLENEKDCTSKAMKAVSDWKSFYEAVLVKFNEFGTQSNLNMDKLALNIDLNEDKLKLFESHFLNMSSKFKKQMNDHSKLKKEFDEIVKSNKHLLEELDSQKVNQTHLKQELEQKIKDVTDTEKKLKVEMEIKLEEASSKLSAAETQNELHKVEISDLHKKLEDELSNLKCTEKKFEEEKKELELGKKLNEDNIKHMNEKIDKFQKQVELLTSEVAQKEATITKILDEQAFLETSNDENLKCMKDKLENAEKNYLTQMDEMRSRVSLLEKEKLALKTEKAELLKSQEKLTDLKNIESAIKLQLKSKEEELLKLQQKYETTHKEQVAKIHGFQETMKDKENMILKLKTNIETLNKDNMEKSEELKKKIKALELEREQLMIQAQERVSITEAKYRDDIKALQDKNNKLLQENNEIEKLKSKIDQLVKEDRENSNLLEASKEEILQLKEKLAKAEEKLSEAQNLKQTSEAELLEKLQTLQAENSSLLGKTNHVESLKAEKEELNEKLKEAEHQMTSIKALENERDTLKNENITLTKELELLKSSGVDESSLQKKFELLKESENSLRVEFDELRSCKEDLEGKLSESKTLFESEIQSRKLENEKLSKQVGMLEKFHSSDPESTSVKEYIAVVRGECAAAIKAKEEEMETKLKHLVRDFCIQMDVKDKDCDKMISEMTEKSQDLEDRLLREHRKEASELRQSLFEKECAFDEMRDHYEESLQKRDKKIKELQVSLRKLSENDQHSGDVLPISEEGSDWDDTWAVPDESLENVSSVEAESCKEHLQQIESLQEEITKCNSEIKELKILLRLSPPESMVNNNNRRDSIQSIPEPTEIETLAKVIAAVLRFSDSQTQQVIRREEARHPTR